MLAMNDDARTTGMGLWTDAREMFDAAELITANPKLALSSAAFYMAGHGLEVSFKAYLRSKGHSLAALRAIGHDIEKAAHEASMHGLNCCYRLSELDSTAIALLTPYYKRKHFEYRVSGYQQLPAPASLMALGNGLLAAIRPICEASVRAQPT